MVPTVGMVLCWLLFIACGRVHAAGPMEEHILFIEAVRRGDQPAVERALAGGVDIDQLTGDDDRGHRYPAIFHAMHAAQWGMAQWLLEQGADVVTPVRERSLFAWAADFGNGEMASRIWARLPAAEQRRLLVANDSWVGALGFGHLEVVRQLERLGFAVQAKDGGAIALHAAVASGRIDCVEHVLALDVPPDGRKQGVTALAWAASRGYIDILGRLLDAGTDVDETSSGFPDLPQWQYGAVTALEAAVIANEPEAVALLLRRGASPTGPDNRAVVWADLAGDAECFRLLRAAGAPNPAAFRFRDWLPMSAGGEVMPRASGAPWGDLATMLRVPSVMGGERPAVLARPTKLAIVPLSPGLEGAESLLLANLSTVGGATLLERTEVRRIMRERGLTLGFGRMPAENRRVGELLGADALVLLRLSRQRERAILETRVVSVATGLVTSLRLSQWDPHALEPWTNETAGQCAADVPRIFTPPREARLVAVAPLSASTNDIEARETERRLTLLLAAQLARLPGVFLLERNELLRLTSEPGAVDGDLLESGWLISGSIEVLGAQAGRAPENRLSLKLESGGQGPARKISAAGRADAPLQLVQAAAREIGTVLSVRADVAWEPLREAGVHYERSRILARSQIWPEAQAAAEAAWALGLQTDDVLRQRVECVAGRLLLINEPPGDSRSRGPKAPKVDDLLLQRVRLVSAGSREGELSMADYLEQAETMLDLFGRSLRRTGKAYGGADYDMWLAGSVWDAATLPLRLGESLSFENEYGPEMRALRARLLALNDEALATAQANGFRAAYHTLLGLRCRLLPWWQPDETRFQAEILRVLHLAREQTPPVAGHPVWGSVYRSGRDMMDGVASRAAQSWVRLARRLRNSTDAEERFLGLAWLGIDEPAGPAEAIRRELEAEFPNLLESDRAWTGAMWAIANDVTRPPGAAYPAVAMPPWYGVALRASWERPQTRISQLPTMWDAGERGLRPLPELKTADLAAFTRKLALMQDKGASCFLWHYGVGGYFSDDELRVLIDAIKQAAPIMQAAVRENPGLASHYLDPANWLRRFERELNDSIAKQRLAEAPALKFGPPRWILPGQGVVGSRDNPARACVIDYFGYQSNGDMWWRASGDGRVFVFRFGRDGLIEDAVAHQTRVGNTHYVLGQGALRSADGGGDVSPDYVVVQANDPWRGPSRLNDCLRLYDRREDRWTTLIPPFPVNLIHDVKIVAGGVYYSFVYNPEVERGRVSQETDYLRKGTPLWCVGEYNIASGTHRLLVSSRRSPAESPLDVGGKEYKDLVKTSDTTLMVRAMPGHVYDAKVRAWRESTADDLAGMRRASTRSLEIEAGGDTWLVSASTGSKIRFQRKNLNSGKRPNAVSIPVEIDTSTMSGSQDADLLRRVAEVERFNFHGSSDGVALSGRNFYAWASAAEVREALEQALARLSP